MRLLTVVIAVLFAIVLAIRVLDRTGVISSVIHRRVALTRKAIENVYLEYKWAEEGSKGPAMIGSFTVTNNNDFDVKDPDGHLRAFHRQRKRRQQHKDHS
jgi:hypothetical protein